MCSAGSTRAVAAEDDAEGVTGGVGEDPEARLTFTWLPVGTQREQLLLGLAGISYADVEMHLLGIRRVWPVRRNPFGDPLKASWRRPGSKPMTTQSSLSSLILIPSTWQ
jgi:hypothetical protein